MTAAETPDELRPRRSAHGESPPADAGPAGTLDALAEADTPAGAHTADPTAVYPAPSNGATVAGPDAPADPSAGPEGLGQVGGYRLLRVLGRGGMGAVYEAEDPRLGRRVAVKVMRRELAERESARARFLREGRAAVAVAHDYIIPVLHVGEDAGVPFLVMPLLPGETLEDRLARGPVPLPEQLAIARQVAEGLAAAHGAGLVHRDVKPSNVWLEADRSGAFRRVRLLDFGLARSAREDGHLTRSGTVMGTPAYMAPEQARDSAKVDHRADLFSLGGVLYRMATGRPAFAGSDPYTLLTAIATTTPPPAAAVNPAVPPRLSALIERLLAKDPDNRPASAAAVADHLTRLGTALAVGGAVPAADPGTVWKGGAAGPTKPDAATPPRRGGGRWPWAVVAAGVVVMLGGAAVYQLVFKTLQGELQVVITDPAVEARFKNGKLELYGADGKLRYTLEPVAMPADKAKKLPPGEYTIRVTGADGLAVDTDRFAIRDGKVETVTVVFAPAKPAGPNPAPAAAQNAGTSDFQELHGADGRALRAWLDGLQVKGFRPVFLSADAGGVPRFNAIAVKDARLLPFRYFVEIEENEKEWNPYFEQTSAAGFRLVCKCYTMKGDTRYISGLWTADVPRFGYWCGPIDFVTRKVREARPHRFRPIDLCAVSQAGKPFFGCLLAPDQGSDWDAHFDLTGDALRKLAARERARGWCLEWVSSYRDNDRIRFLAISVDNRDKLDWNLQLDLTAAAYEQALAEQKLLGLRPLTVTSYDPGVGTRYAAIFASARSSELPPAAGGSPAAGDPQGQPGGVVPGPRTASDKPPAKDAFQGEVIAYETFDDPAKCPFPEVKTAVKHSRCEAGVFVTDVPKARAGAVPVLVPFAGPAQDVAVIARVRGTNCPPAIEFRRRADNTRGTNLVFYTDAEGKWVLHRVTWELVGGAWKSSSKVLGRAASGFPDLMPGQWFTLKVRSVAGVTEVWAGSQAYAKVTEPDDPDDHLLPDSEGVRIGGQSLAAGPARFEIDHVAVWKLPPAAAPKK